MASYHLREYWDQRYETDQEPFEWYQRFCDIKPKISDCIPKGARVLVVGAGSSELSFDLYDDKDLEVSSVVSVDISAVVVKRMQDMIGDRKGVEYHVQDVCDLQFPAASFDCVLDKATLDSILCGEDAKTRVPQALDAIFKVLKPQGYFLSVSYANAEMRMHYLTRAELDWDIDVREIPKPCLLDTQAASDDFHYLYVCHKRGEAAPADPKGKKK